MRNGRSGGLGDNASFRVELERIARLAQQFNRPEIGLNSLRCQPPNPDGVDSCFFDGVAWKMKEPLGHVPLRCEVELPIAIVVQNQLTRWNLERGDGKRRQHRGPGADESTISVRDVKLLASALPPEDVPILLFRAILDPLAELAEGGQPLPISL